MSANSEASYQSNAISGNNNSNSTPPEINFAQLPAKKLLKERDLPKPKDSKPWEEVDLPVDILLLTSVNEWEFSSCVSYFNPGFFRSYHKTHGYVYFGEIGDENTTKVALIKCQKGSSGPGASTVTVRNAIPLLKPKAVICVGACGGLNESKLKLGDVVVSSKLGTYNPAKVKESGTDVRGVEVFVNRDLLYLLNTAANGWEPPLTATDERVPMVHNGEFLSGPEVVNSKKRRAQLTKKFSDALAIEMEAEGEY